ncbi:hypothetical protein Y032_0017g3202 [Ancylostoma ceylanicum]|uniref:Uncharacterized protein n=1 Tax=Ancylostoma ceylanicum TaxID=53326 RepID=A0A016V4K5_9BILA|nr:hypothetical protein Y032_0017g3202 [Ancylostoma ceylanicum]
MQKNSVGQNRGCAKYVAATVRDLRTRNSAEAFQSKLCKLLSNLIHPLFEDVLELIQQMSMAVLGTLFHMGANRNTL